MIFHSYVSLPEGSTWNVGGSILKIDGLEV